MRYNPQYNGGQNRYGFTPYNSGYNNGRGGYNNNFRRGKDYNYKPPKRSGCKSGQTRDGKIYVRGWKFDKTHGLRAFIAGPNKKTHRVESGNGRSWENWTAKVTGPNGVQLYNALYSPDSGRVFIKELGIVMSPKSNYTGPFFRRK